MDSLLKSQTHNAETAGEITDVVDLNTNTEVAVTVAPAPVADSAMETDYEIARKNLKNLLEDGQEALQQLLQIADASQHPRSYEVVATLIKTLAETSSELMTLAKKKHDISNDTSDSPGDTINNNTIYVGSTSELQKLINKNRNG